MAIGSLAVRVTTNTGPFNKGMTGAGKRAKQFGRDVSSVTRTATAMTAAVTAAAAGVAVLANQSIQSGKELANFSRLANASATEFQKMAFGAKTVGIEQEKLADILKDVNDRVGDFITTGGGQMADFFERIGPKVGVTAEHFRKLSGPQALQLYVSSLEKANVSQQEMTFFMEAMANDATRLLPLLQNGGKAMGEQADQAERLGIAMSDVDVEQLRQAGIAIDQSTEILTSFLDQFTVKMVPVLTAFSEMLMQNAEDAGGVGEVAENAFNTVIDGVALVMNGLDALDRGLLQSQTAVDTFALAFRVGLLEIAREIVEIPTAAINELLMMINAIPGLKDVDLLGMSDLGRKVQSQIDNANREIGTLRTNMEEELSKPLKGDTFERIVFQHAEAGRKSAEAMVTARNKMEADMAAASGSSGRGPDDTDPAAVEEEKAKLKREKMMEAFEQEYIMTEEFNLRMAELRDLYEDSDIASQEDYQQARLDKMRSFFNEQYGIQSSGLDGLSNLAAKFWDAETGMAVDAFGQILNAFSGNSRKIFEIQKAAGIANAIVSTYTGASKALELGWPLGPIAAAAITAKGFAQVAAIKSQSFGGGGGSSSSAGGGGSSNLGGATQQQQTQPQQPQTVANISLVGDVFSRDSVKGLMEQMGDLFDDGMRLRVT